VLWAMHTLQKPSFIKKSIQAFIGKTLRELSQKLILTLHMKLKSTHVSKKINE